MSNLKLAIAGFAEKLVGFLPLLWRTELFRIAARSIGVKYAGFPGKEGIFEAPVYDRIGSSLYVVHGDLDTGMRDFLKRVFKQGAGTLVDVGANIGMVCIPIKRDLPGVDVYAVEPHSDNAECLRINAYRVGISDIQLLNRAAYKQEAILDFEHSPDNAGDHRIRGSHAEQADGHYAESTRTVTKVQASPLDTMIPIGRLKSPVVMKCDVQGAEADVLAGASNLLNSVDVLLIEFWPYGLRRAGANLEALLSALSGFPYGARFDVMDAASIRMRPIQELAGELRQFYSEEAGIAHWDIVLSKKPL